MNLQQRCSSVLKIGTQLFVLLLITLGSDRTFACQSADSAADVPVRNVLFIVSDDLRAGEMGSAQV